MRRRKQNWKPSTRPWRCSRFSCNWAQEKGYFLRVQLRRVKVKISRFCTVFHWDILSVSSVMCFPDLRFNVCSKISHAILKSWIKINQPLHKNLESYTLTKHQSTEAAKILELWKKCIQHFRRTEELFQQLEGISSSENFVSAADPWSCLGCGGGENGFVGMKILGNLNGKGYVKQK